VLTLVDIVRLDHFRGFAGYWEIPGDAETAVKGRWRDGPGADFFHTVKDTLGELPIIAEDLGEITPDVIELRDQFNLPGMKVLVFAFNSGPENEFLPHNFTEDCAVYTGTHDNDTVRGWFERVEDWEKDYARRYLGVSGENIAWDVIRAAWSSVAAYALAPLQDLLGLGNEARMNYPGSSQGNWTWRYRPDALTEDLEKKLLEFNQTYGRES
jgi:4-alpha-glucanotransferase